MTVRAGQVWRYDALKRGVEAHGLLFLVVRVERQATLLNLDTGKLLGGYPPSAFEDEAWTLESKP